MVNSAAIIRALGGFLALLSGPTLLCAYWAFHNDRYSQSSLFILVATTSIVVSGLFFLATKDAKHSKTQLKDVVAFLIAAWITLSLFGSIPFLSVAHGNFSLAIFESVSCSTTTGVSMVGADIYLPASLIAWRGILHMVGAILSVTGVMIVFSFIGKETTGISSGAISKFGHGLSLKAFFPALLFTGGIMLTVSAIGSAILLSEGVGLREAYGDSISAITTGMVIPYEDVSFTHDSFGKVWLIIMLVLGTINFSLLNDVIVKPLQIFKNREAQGLLVLIILLTGLLYMLPEFQGDIVDHIGSAVSIISTSGLLLSDANLETISIPILLYFGFIGGSVISATGGMKIYRIQVLIARSGHEFARLAQPRAVLSFRHQGRHFPVQVVMAVWAYLVAFAIISLILAMILTFSGASFGEAIQASMGAITNSAVLFHTDWLPHDKSAGILELILSAFMILGRLELLLLLSLIFSD